MTYIFVEVDEIQYFFYHYNRGNDGNTLRCAAHSYELNRHGRKRNWRGPPPKRPRLILKLVPVWLQARMEFISITLSDLQI